MLNIIIENEIFWLIVLIIYVFLVATLTKKLYSRMIKKGANEDSAIYVNRKMVHIFAGGVVVLIVPFVFKSPWYPLLCGLALTILTLISHRRGNAMYWFQTNKNQYDVNCLPSLLEADDSLASLARQTQQKTKTIYIDF